MRNTVKILGVLLGAAAFITLMLLPCAPLFDGDNYAVYVCNANTGGKIIYTDNPFTVKLASNAEGESVVYSKDGLSAAREIVKKYKAVEVLHESYEGGVNFYYRAKSIPYAVTVGGDEINLHISVSCADRLGLFAQGLIYEGEYGRVTVGAPIIYGWY